MSHTPLHASFDGIAGLRMALDQGAVSATELAQSALQAIDDQTALNAFLHVDAELTLAQARAADARIAVGQAGPLTGIPIAHKDTFVTRGWRTTAGSRMLAEYVSPFDASVVEKLIAAGTVSLGKLNCDEFAMGSANENSAFGPVRNPWDQKVVPGGSSGGSAAAVAAGLVPAATGTDTGGSVRQPAALCGVSGIKPTYGAVSRFGIIAYGSSLDQAGPLARSARDVYLMLDAIAGFDPRDATSHDIADGWLERDYEASRTAQNEAGARPLDGLRIGLPREYFSAGLDPQVAAAIEAALREFEALGARRVDISLPRTALAIPAYYVIAPAEASSNLARYDGVRYGHRAAQFSDLNDMISRSRAEGFGIETQRRILLGTYVLSHGYYDAYYLQAQRLRRLIAEDFQKVLSEQCDLILGPVTPQAARGIGENSEDPRADWLSDIYTLGVNLAGLPSVAIPCGFDSTRQRPLPIGMQLIGNHFQDGRLLAIAERYQQVTDWHQRKPESL